MLDEKWITIGVWIHAILGGLGLLAGAWALMVTKGGKYHRAAGKIFFVSMQIGVVLSMCIALLPGHKSLFLFLIGWFTLYMMWAGVLILRVSKVRNPGWPHYLVTISMVVSAAGMIFLAIKNLVAGGQAGWVLGVFGGIGLSLSLQDLRFFKQVPKQPVLRIHSHIGRMVGAYIAAFTAFLVAGVKFHGLVPWLLPTVLGTLAIIYWTRKYPIKSNMQSES